MNGVTLIETACREQNLNAVYGLFSGGHDSLLGCYYASTRERPILFRPELVQAILEGRKIQTRRPLKPQPSSVDESGAWYRMPSGGKSLNCYSCPYGDPEVGQALKRQFLDKWQRMYRGTDYDSPNNPWVWVITFKRIEP